jgi:sulfide dehydrogenase cytochrome subunit
MKKTILSLVCLCSLSFAVEYDPLKGKMLSLSCASCHGTDGKSVAITPAIAGMAKGLIYQKLLNYKYETDITVSSTIMPKHVKGFTDEELEQVAYYFSKVER